MVKYEVFTLKAVIGCVSVTWGQCNSVTVGFGISLWASGSLACSCCRGFVLAWFRQTGGRVVTWLLSFRCFFWWVSFEWSCSTTSLYWADSSVSCLATALVETLSWTDGWTEAQFSRDAVRLRFRLPSFNPDSPTHTHTHTHTHVGFYGLRGLSIGVMVFILYKLYVLLPYTYPTPKLSPHRRRCISIFPQKNSLCMIYKRFKLWGHWKCPHKSLSPCNTYVLPMSLYKCPHKPHKHAHTHTHTHTHTIR